jgi:ribose-phosphate pyrophosphokinase
VDEKFKIFSGTANEALADEVCHFLGLTRGQAMITRFRDGECYLQIQENVRGADVFVMQPTCRPVDEHLMELLLMIDALKRASARRITVPLKILNFSSTRGRALRSLFSSGTCWPFFSAGDTKVAIWALS